MAISLDKLGTKSEPRPFTVEPERALEYAAATNDSNPAYTSGKYAPPVFAVVPALEAMGQLATAVVPAEALMMIVHGEQDMHFHRPLVPGDELVTTGEVFNVRVASSGTRVTFRVVSAEAEAGAGSGAGAVSGAGGTAGDAPVVEQYSTIFVRGMTDGESGGPDKPDHTFPEEARARLIGESAVHVDGDQTFRYSKASGDMMPIHLDEAMAKSVGLPGIIAHGLCTMAMCGQSILALTAGADPARLKRLAVRFSKNVFPGNDVVTQAYAAGERDGRRLIAFEAGSAGDGVVKNGWAEIG